MIETMPVVKGLDYDQMLLTKLSSDVFVPELNVYIIRRTEDVDRDHAEFLYQTTSCRRL
jgi:hypothetical protein